MLTSKLSTKFYIFVGSVLYPESNFMVEIAKRRNFLVFNAPFFFPSHFQSLDLHLHPYANT